MSLAKTRRGKRRRRFGRSGATAVEFSLVLPIIFAIVFGLMEWGRFEMIQQVTLTAGFNGARMGTLPGTTSTEIEEFVDDVLAVYFISGATTEVNLSETEANVRVSVPLNDNSLVLLRFFNDLSLEREFTLEIR